MIISITTFTIPIFDINVQATGDEVGFYIMKINEGEDFTATDIQLCVFGATSKDDFELSVYKDGVEIYNESNFGYYPFGDYAKIWMTDDYGGNISATSIQCDEIYFGARNNTIKSVTLATTPYLNVEQTSGAYDSTNGFNVDDPYKVVHGGVIDGGLMPIQENQFEEYIVYQVLNEDDSEGMFYAEYFSVFPNINHVSNSAIEGYKSIYWSGMGDREVFSSVDGEVWELESMSLNSIFARFASEDFIKIIASSQDIVDVFSGETISAPMEDIPNEDNDLFLKILSPTIDTETIKDTIILELQFTYPMKHPLDNGIVTGYIPNAPQMYSSSVPLNDQTLLYEGYSDADNLRIHTYRYEVPISDGTNNILITGGVDYAYVGTGLGSIPDSTLTASASTRVVKVTSTDVDADGKDDTTNEEIDDQSPYDDSIIDNGGNTIVDNSVKDGMVGLEDSFTLSFSEILNTIQNFIPLLSSAFTWLPMQLRVLITASFTIGIISFVLGRR